MSFLPIVERELRIRSRRRSTYRFRQGGALIAIVVVGFALVGSGGFVGPGASGGTLFAILAWMVFIACLLEGARNTADCLSEEKRAGTLGLLFLTDLKGYDVVLGKLMATSLNSFYSLLAIFPPLAMPLLLGGVTAGEFWRLVLLLTNTLFFALAIGMFVSAISRNERKAWSSTLVLIGLLAIVPPSLEAANLSWFSGLSPLSPTTALISLFDAVYASAPETYWASLWTVHGLSWLFLGLASYLLPRTWQDIPKGIEGSWIRGLLGRWRRSDAFNARRQRNRLLQLNPVLWLAGRHEEQQFYLWLLVGLSGGTAIISWLIAPGAEEVALTIFSCGLVLHFLLAIWMASEASYLFAEARDSGAFELLFSTPLTAQDILAGHYLALRKLFQGPVTALLGVECLILAGHLILLRATGDHLFEGLLTATAAGLCVTMFILDLHAAGRFGMWMGLTSKKPSQALTKTVLFVLVLPLLTIFCCGFVWPVMAIVKDLIFINYADDQLRRRLRVEITRRLAGVAEDPAWRGTPSLRPKSQLPPVIEN